MSMRQFATKDDYFRAEIAARDATIAELLEALQKLERYFVSGNCIPIERAVITRDSFEEIARAAIEKATKP